MIKCTVGVMAYNEEHNIVQVLHALLDQQLDLCDMREIIVVASGCTDRTVELARQVAQTNPRIAIDIQPQRLGKAGAINRLISIAHGEVIVLVGADTLPDPTALDHLIKPFEDPTVGMTGARVVPLNDPRTFLGFTVQLLWQVHHLMALRWPKLGELVAFRKVIAELPLDSATDEVTLEALIGAQGYRLVYVPEAIVYNRGPETLGDFMNQRRRIFAGHLHIAAIYKYVAASVPLMHVGILTLKVIRLFPGMLLWIAGAVLLECWARLLGSLDAALGRSHHIWKPIPSTKQIRLNQRMFALIAFQYGANRIRPDCLMRITRRVPSSQGVLFWWDYERREVMFMVPASQPRLAESAGELAAYITRDPQFAGSAVLSFRVVQFAAPSGLSSVA